VKPLRTRLALACALLVPLSSAMGCTIRYSQALVGSIERISTRPISTNDTGTEVGIGGPGAPPLAITFSEPMAPHELLSLPCEILVTQIDYRGKYYAYYIGVNFPETEITSYCVSP